VKARSRDERVAPSRARTQKALNKTLQKTLQKKSGTGVSGTANLDPCVNELYAAVLDSVWLVDPASLCVVWANPAAGTLMQADAQALHGLEILSLLVCPEDMYFWAEVASGLSDEIESRTLVCRPDGHTTPVLRCVRTVQVPTASSVVKASKRMLIVTLRDLTEQLRCEHERDDRLAELSATLESSRDGILVTDLKGNIRNFNRRFAELWDVPPAMLTLRDDDAVLGWMRRSVIDPAAYMRRLAAIDGAAFEQNTARVLDIVQLRTAVTLERSSLPQCSRGLTIGRVYAFRDITEELANEKRVSALASIDALTGVANRAALTTKIGAVLGMAQRRNQRRNHQAHGSASALMTLNLDRFHDINTRLGSAFGDRVLVEVAARLTAAVRHVDTVARIGGDEFALLIHPTDAAGAEHTAQRILSALQQPFCLDDISFTLTASLGIAMHLWPNEQAEELLQSADAAMRQVKHQGGNRYGLHATAQTVPGSSWH
jgi:diguanylate cyclase (GGDEF)-like protein